MWAENEPALRFFLAVAGQWRIAGYPPRPVALDYAAIEATARMSGVTLTPGLFADLRVMEAAAVAAWSRRVRKGDGR